MSNSQSGGRVLRVAILTVSDSVVAGKRADVSGPTLRSLVEAEGMHVVAADVVPDEVSEIATWLERSAIKADLLFTCGGTGLGPRDVTPEATRTVAERLVPGIAEALRAAGLPHTPKAMLSRAVAGVIGNSLVINLPGSPAAIEQQFPVVAPVLEHAVALLHGETAH